MPTSVWNGFPCVGPSVALAAHVRRRLVGFQCEVEVCASAHSFDSPVGISHTQPAEAYATTRRVTTPYTQFDVGLLRQQWASCRVAVNKTFT